MTAKRPTQSQVIEKLTAAFDTAHARAKALIDRQDEIVRGLGRIQKLLKLGAGEAAMTAMEDLLATDLKQARERVYNQDAALRMAVGGLRRRCEAGYCSDEKMVAEMGKCVTCSTLDQILTLVPSAFETAPTPEGVS